MGQAMGVLGIVVKTDIPSIDERIRSRDGLKGGVVCGGKQGGGAWCSRLGRCLQRPLFGLFVFVKLGVQSSSGRPPKLAEVQQVVQQPQSSQRPATSCQPE